MPSSNGHSVPHQLSHGTGKGDKTGQHPKPQDKTLPAVWQQHTDLPTWARCAAATTTRVAQAGPAVAPAHLTASCPLEWAGITSQCPSATLPRALSRAEGTHHSALGEGSGRRCNKCHCASAALRSWASSTGLGSSPPGKESSPGSLQHLCPLQRGQSSGTQMDKAISKHWVDSLRSGIMQTLCTPQS